MSPKKKLVVVGNGMVGHRFLERLVEARGTERYDVTVFCEEPRLAYDRVNLSKLFDQAKAEENDKDATHDPAAKLALVQPGTYQAAGIVVRLADRAASIDRAAKTVRSVRGDDVPYDVLVLATGSYPFVPPVEGKDRPGCFVYRTIEDLEAIRAWASRPEVQAGAVIGGGLLGLEAANALQSLGLETHVLEVAPRLMPLQVDEMGGAILKRRIEGLGVGVHTGVSTKRIAGPSDDAAADARAPVSRILFADGGALAADVVVFSAGIRPNDALARAAGLDVGERGGVVVDEHCRAKNDRDVFAIGECASWAGRTYGLVAPGYKMAEIVAAELVSGESEALGHFDMSSKLKLLGVDVASFGDAFGLEAGTHTLCLVDSVQGVYKKLVVSADKELLLGGILVGDASAYGQMLAMVQSRIKLPAAPDELILPERSGKPRGLGPDALPMEAGICSCNNVTKGAICNAIATQNLTTIGAVKSCTKAGTSCGSCVPLVTDILKAELRRAGVVVTNHLCEHFPHSRQELFHLTKVRQTKTFDAAIASFGRGAGCEICKPAMASILASIFNEHVLKKEHVGLQDSNDRFLANVQRDGTYSVVPRVAGGEILPRQLIALGEVAERYGLYTKITGGQRVDLFGARVEQLPHIWRELIAAGFESGHAYGKALRTVKSCVGSTWCRYGVQDSVAFAIRVENRYKGLRAPHKLKSAVSGCARECAEAQSKDFGIIATEKGYNLYVCGNGGMKPQHAQLLAQDLDEQTLLRYVDRFLMFYVRTADRLERTATWFNKLEGGLDYLKSVVVDDALGLCAELEAEMQHIVDTYQDEWRTAVEDPSVARRFRAFVNSDAADPSIVRVPLRQQHRPATWQEKQEKQTTASPAREENAA
ncbi:MAG TPA: nitrite reductase large subunit NirB [Polyangia bacterium]|nr:nitrite reductase large subunit NirB [Polyangia bacterium]